MSLLRTKGYAGDLERQVFPGDVIGGGEVISTLTTVGAGTVTGAMIATGLLRRTGPVGGFTDTFDTAANILTALAGNNNPGANVVPGTTFRLRYINAVAQAMTYAGGQGMVSGTGTLNVAASVIRDYLLTVLATGPLLTLSATFTTTTLPVTFVLPPNMSAFPLGSADNPNGLLINQGMGVIDNTTSGNLSAATTVAGIIQGQGGIIGVSLNQNTAGTSAAAGDSLTFFPRIQIDSLGSLAA